MSNREPRKRKGLKVQVSFETSRVADECLASAKEQVVPLVSRVTAEQRPAQPQQRPAQTLRAVGGEACV